MSVTWPRYPEVSMSSFARLLHNINYDAILFIDQHLADNLVAGCTVFKNKHVPRAEWVHWCIYRSIYMFSIIWMEKHTFILEALNNTYIEHYMLFMSLLLNPVPLYYFSPLLSLIIEWCLNTGAPLFHNSRIKLFNMQRFTRTVYLQNNFWFPDVKTCKYKWPS